MRKNYPFVLLLLLASVVMSSCNKTWNCECSSRGKVLQVIPIKSLTKFGAKNVCDSYQEENNRTINAQEVCVIK
ncbi:MAG: hypothetical protein U0X41_08705 [Chitinophagales bacterium]